MADREGYELYNGEEWLFNVVDDLEWFSSG